MKFGRLLVIDGKPGRDVAGFGLVARCGSRDMFVVVVVCPLRISDVVLMTATVTCLVLSVGRRWV